MLRAATPVFCLSLLLAACSFDSLGGGGSTSDTLPATTNGGGEGQGLARPPSLDEGEGGASGAEGDFSSLAEPDQGFDPNQPEPVISSDGQTISIREGDLNTQEIRQQTDQEREAVRSAELETCYQYAHAQTLHDRQIISDQNAAFDDSTFDQNLSQIQLRAEYFGQQRRERRLIHNCMASRGFESR